MSESPEAAELNAKVGKTPEETLLEAIEFAYGGGGSGRRPALEALASLRQRQEELEDELDAANESIGISREHLSRAGFEAAFFDDAAAQAANEVLSLRTQLQQAETALRQIEADDHDGIDYEEHIRFSTEHGILGDCFGCIARAALAAPPAEPQTSSQEKP